MPLPPRRRPPARSGSGVTPVASRDAEENALLDMRVLGQSLRATARVAGPARGHSPKYRTDDAPSASAGGVVRPSPARARAGAFDEDHVSDASVSLALAETGEPAGSSGETERAFAKTSLSSPSADARASGEAFDVARRVSSLRVAERSLARASSLSKLADERRSDEARDSRPEPRSADAEGATSRKTADGDARGRATDSPSLAARAVGTRAPFLEPRASVRGRSRDAPARSGTGAAGLAARDGGRADAAETPRRPKASPRAVSARREKARRRDCDRVVSGDDAPCPKKTLPRDARRGSSCRWYWCACRSDAERVTFAEALESARVARGARVTRAGALADSALPVVEGEARFGEPSAPSSRGFARNDADGCRATCLGEMGRFREGGRGAAGAAARGRAAKRGSGGDSASDSASDSARDSASDVREETFGEDAEAETSETAAKTETETETETTRRRARARAARVAFDAFVDFFAAPPISATRARGAFAVAATRWPERRRSLASIEPRISELDASHAKPRHGAKRRGDAAREEKDTRLVCEGSRGVPRARARFEDERAAFASSAPEAEACFPPETQPVASFERERRASARRASRGRCSRARYRTPSRKRRSPSGRRGERSNDAGDVV